MMKTNGNDLPQAYHDWKASEVCEVPCDAATLKANIESELDRFRAMTSQEYILWQKWEEVRDAYPMEQSILYDEPAYKNARDARTIKQVKTMLWNGYYEDIQPELIWIGDPKHEAIREHWTALRILIHSQQHSGTVGRAINYLCRDRSTHDYLGVISLASDFLDLGPRDTAIGWTREARTQGQMIQHTAVCSTVVPVQPFGFNYAGGKLLALLCLSEPVQAKWKELYGHTLVGMTTTSLWGQGKGISQYDNLRFWQRMGYSRGSTAFRPSITLRREMYKWAKLALPEEYWKYIVSKEDEWVVRDRYNRLHQAIYRALKIPAKAYTSNHDRGIYFAKLYRNAFEFLRGEILERDLVTVTTPTCDLTVNGLTKYWKEKIAAYRWKQLLNSSVAGNNLFYDDLSLLTWEEAKAKYLQDVGR